MKISCPKLWQGGTVFILGGGPSFNLEKEKNISLIKDKRVIGTNVAYTLGDWIDIVWFGDLKFWRYHKARLREYPSLVMTCNDNTTLNEYTWLKQLRRKGSATGICTDRRYVCWNRNTGSSAINLAYHLGAKRVVLLGFDMKEVAKEKHEDGRPIKNWHDVHKKYETRKMQESLGCYKRYLKCMPDIKRDADKLGLEIINATPNSAIVQFPFAKLEDLV